MESKVKLMAGAALCLAANQYPRLAQVVKEAVQNGLDAGATVIAVEINRKKREIAIRDNGKGVTHAEFEQALQSVCRSVKSHDKLGQFGIGLIAALGKCREFMFTTLGPDKRSAWRWHFVCDHIKQMQDVEVPYEKAVIDVLLPKPGQVHGVRQWTSELRIIKYTDDRQIGRLDVNELRQEILANFAVAMREKKATVWIAQVDVSGAILEPVQIKASDFAGRRLQEEKIRSGNGMTTIRLFVVPRTAKNKRKGAVSVGVDNNAFRVPFKLFARQLEPLGFLEPDIISALLSGVFEGEILHSSITLEANRKSFAENDALLDLCVQIGSWFEKTGREHIERAQDSNTAERLQDLARRSLENLKKFLDSSVEFAELLRQGKLGRVTDDHTKPSRGATAGKEEVNTLSSTRTDPKPGSGGGHANGVPHKALSEHVPYTATGPNGKQRTLVRGDSQGLNFSHVEMDSDDLWRFDLATVTLFFNITHPQWVACDRNDRDIMRLQELIATHAITAELMPEAERIYVRPFLKKLIEPTVHVLRDSQAFTLGFGSRAKRD